MRRQIRHITGRVLAIALVIAILCPIICLHGLRAHADESEYEEAVFTLNSTITGKESITVYLHNSIYYITIDDLCLLTRCSKSIEGTIITVTQGIWNGSFDLEKQTFSDGIQTVEVEILNISTNTWAVPAIMFLSYYKAAAHFADDTLYCRMPEFTAWEALDVDFEDSLIDIYELYGGETNIEISLWLDILNDFIMGDMSTSGGYLDNAFFAALKVDLYNAPAVQKYVSSEQEKLYKDIHSDKGIAFVESLKEHVDTFSDTLSYSEEPTKWLIQFYFNELEKSFVKMRYDAYEIGNHADVARYGEQFYEAYKEKNNISEFSEKYFKNADYIMLFVSAAVNTALEAKYMKATDNLIYNVMGSENTKALGLSVGDNDWFRLANNYKNILGMGANQFFSEAARLFTDKLSWETLVGTAVTSAADITGAQWSFCLNISRTFVKLFPLTSSSIKAFQSDRVAIYLSELQSNVYYVAYNTVKRLSQDEDNIDLYLKYVQALQLYCRTSIAMYENLIISVKGFDKNPTYWERQFQAKADKLYVSLYQLTSLLDDGITNCLPLDLRSINYVDTSTVTVQPDYSLYLDAITRAQNISVYQSGEGYLYDLDEDGVEELFLMYCAEFPRDIGDTFPCSACSVYTIHNNNLITLMDNCKLREQAGGGIDSIGVFRVNNQELFATHVCSAWEEGSGDYWKLYSLSSNSFQLEKNIEGHLKYYLHDYSTDYDSSYSLFDGDQSNYSKYEDWVEGVETVFEIDGYDYREDSGITYEELARMIQRKSTEQLDYSSGQSSVAPKSEKEIYSAYILSGGCDNILDRVAKYSVSGYSQEPLVQSTLVDINGDGTKECFIFFSDPSGWNANTGVYYLLALRDGIVKELYSATNPGGNSMWSDCNLMKDTKSGRIVIVEGNYWRDGVYSGGVTRTVYSYSEAGITSSEEYVAERYAKPEYVSYNKEVLDIVKAATVLYYEDDVDFWFYKFSDEYISEEEYERLLAQYISLGDEYSFVKGSIDTPIP